MSGEVDSNLDRLEFKDICTSNTARDCTNSNLDRLEFKEEIST